MFAEKPGAAVPSVSSERHVDLDLHGALCVRLVDASPGDVETLTRSLGPLTPGNGAAPDVQVRFVPKLPTSGLRYTELHRSGFNGDGLHFLWNGGRPGAARVPMEDLGQRPEIVCLRGAAPVAPLLDALELAAIAKGLIPFHGAAFSYRGEGVLVAGWPHSGKTSALLAFMEQGARFIADDMVLLDPADRRVLGIATPMELWDWQLAQLDGAWRTVPMARRTVYRTLMAADPRMAGRSARGRPRVRGGWLSVVRALRRRLRSTRSIGELFPGQEAGGARVSKIFLTVVHESPEILVERASSRGTLEQVRHLARRDALPLFERYLAHRFAFPDRLNPLLEADPAPGAHRIPEALAGVDCWVVYHPRPVSFRDLHEAMMSAWVVPSGSAVPLQPAAGGIS